MNLFFWRRRGLDDFAEGIRPELQALSIPEPSGDLLERILASREAGTRVILPVVRETGRPPLPRIASAVAVAAVLLLLAVPIREWVGRNALPSEGSAGAGFFGQVAFAQAPGAGVPGVPPMRLERAGALRPLAVQYERRIRDNTGRLTSALRSDVALTAAMIDGVAAWKVTSLGRDATTGQHRADIETTYVARDDLRLLSRSIHVAPYSRYARINVQQRFAGDSVTGRMTTDGRSIGKGRTIARRLRPEFAPYFANAFGPFLLMAAPLARDWRGSASLVGWAVKPNDVVVPIELRVEGEERIQLPAGTFDCWRVSIRIAQKKITYWARKSDGLGVRVLDESEQPSHGTRETVLTRFP
jgi:hypothetical protein